MQCDHVWWLHGAYGCTTLSGCDGIGVTQTLRGGVNIILGDLPCKLHGAKTEDSFHRVIHTRMDMSCIILVCTAWSLMPAFKSHVRYSPSSLYVQGQYKSTFASITWQPPFCVQSYFRSLSRYIRTHAAPPDLYLQPQTLRHICSHLLLVHQFLTHIIFPSVRGYVCLFVL